jgi:hypothetical protein
MTQLSPDQIDMIRTARGCNVPWEKIARHLETSVDTCRAAIGLPARPKLESKSAVPWADNEPSDDGESA